MFYKFANLLKKLELEKYLFRGYKMSYTAQIPDLAITADFA
jgi:hypothetical protein